MNVGSETSSMVRCSIVSGVWEAAVHQVSALFHTHTQTASNFISSLRFKKMHKKPVRENRMWDQLNDSTSILLKINSKIGLSCWSIHPSKGNARKMFVKVILATVLCTFMCYASFFNTNVETQECNPINGTTKLSGSEIFQLAPLE